MRFRTKKLLSFDSQNEKIKFSKNNPFSRLEKQKFIFKQKILIRQK